MSARKNAQMRRKTGQKRSKYVAGVTSFAKMKDSNQIYQPTLVWAGVMQDVLMIKINKINKFSIVIFLDELEVENILKKMEKEKNINLSLSENSTGLKNKLINRFNINKCDYSFVREDNNELILNLDFGDFDYLVFKLLDRLKNGNYVPSELFSIESSKCEINFYLMNFE